MSLTIYLAGCFTGSVLLVLVKLLFRFIERHLRGESVIYGLHHGILNAEMPPKSMWINMGYWKVT